MKVNSDAINLVLTFMACARLNNAFTLLGDNWSALVQSSQAAVGYKYNYMSTKVIMVLCTYCTKFEVAQCTVAVSNRVVRTQLDALRIAQHCFRIFALYKHYTLSYLKQSLKYTFINITMLNIYSPF